MNNTDILYMLYVIKLYWFLSILYVLFTYINFYFIFFTLCVFEIFIDLGCRVPSQ